MNDDSDIKIFTPVAKKTAEENFAYTDEVKKHQLNGNIRKARELGRAAARAFVSDESVSARAELAKENGVEINADILRQLMVLSVFTAEYSISRCVTPDMLAKETQSAMYAEMLKSAPGAYDDLLRSASFSFYYMTVGGRSASPDNIASTFAMVCGDKHSRPLFELGRTLYERCVQKYGKMIADVDFEK